MLSLSPEDMKNIQSYLLQHEDINATMLNGFACSASDNSCGCGWDCSSSKT